MNDNQVQERDRLFSSRSEYSQEKVERREEIVTALQIVIAIWGNRMAFHRDLE
jgi:hypothetical protein